jgi:serine protease AprX
MPSIAFVDSGIDASRADFGGRVLAQLDLTSIENNSPGDGNGHGTLVAGLAAGSAPRHAGAAPTAGIVSLDVMDDQGMARTSDVIAAAQWILKNHRQYNIRVANFSLHSASPTSFRWDPLDKAVEKLWFAGVVVVAASGNQAQGGQRTPMAYSPANDPFVITVGALDLHNSTNPDRADLAPWSAWGYTLDGFAKPELSAPGRAIVGPVPAGSTLSREKPKQVINAPEGTYIQLSGTSLSAPIVSGIVADLLALKPALSPDQVKGALMLKARPLRKVRTLAGGVGEVYAPAAAALQSPPNPNRALDAFLVPDPDGDGESLVFDDVSWLDAARASISWDAVSWLDVSWADAAWSDVSWSDVSWSDVSWSDVSWSDVSWSDVSWSDVSWADVQSNVYGDVGP